MLSMVSRLIVLAFFASTLSGCLYQMPEADHVDLRPTTNNPNVVSQGNDGWMPGVSY